MTAQAREVLILDGVWEDMAACPLESHPITRHFKLEDLSDRFSTGCHRGYRGVWEVLDDHLWLVGLFDAMGEPADARLIFGNQPLPARADWFSGTLLLMRGPRLTYYHAGWGGVYAQHLRLYVREGRVVRRRRYDQTRRFRQDSLEAFGDEAGGLAWLREPPQGIRPMWWFTAQGLKALGIDRTAVDPAWVLSTDPDDEDEPRPWEWERKMLAQCRRPPGAPALEARPVA